VNLKRYTLLLLATLFCFQPEFGQNNCASGAEPSTGNNSQVEELLKQVEKAEVAGTQDAKTIQREHPFLNEYDVRLHIQQARGKQLTEVIDRVIDKLTKLGSAAAPGIVSELKSEPIEIQALEALMDPGYDVRPRLTDESLPPDLRQLVAITLLQPLGQDVAKLVTDRVLDGSMTIDGYPKTPHKASEILWHIGVEALPQVARLVHNQRTRPAAIQLVRQILRFNQLTTEADLSGLSDFGFKGVLRHNLLALGRVSSPHRYGTLLQVPDDLRSDVIAAASAPDGRMREAACYIVGQIKSQKGETVTLLEKSLSSDQAVEVRLTCADALAHICQQPATIAQAREIISALQCSRSHDSSDKVREKAESALRTCADFSDLVAAIADINLEKEDVRLSDLRDELGKESIDDLLNFVTPRHGDAPLHAKLRYQIGDFGASPVAPIVALELIGAKGAAAARAVPQLVAGAAQATYDTEFPLRSRFARTFGEIGPPATAAVPILTAWLNDRHRLVRHDAIVALGLIGPGASAAKNALSTTKNDAWLDSASAQALRRIDKHQ
jgi:HEAT repeat protein